MMRKLRLREVTYLGLPVPPFPKACLLISQLRLALPSSPDIHPPIKVLAQGQGGASLGHHSPSSCLGEKSGPLLSNPTPERDPRAEPAKGWGCTPFHRGPFAQAGT